MKTNYKKQDGCYNCKKCVSSWDHESTTYYCNGDDSIVPKEYQTVYTRDVAKDNNMTENELLALPQDEFDKLWDIRGAKLDIEFGKRQDWEDGRRVEAYGTCDEWTDELDIFENAKRVADEFGCWTIEEEEG